MVPHRPKALGRALLRLLPLLAACVVAAASESPCSNFEEWTWTPSGDFADEHYEFGRAMGEYFATSIGERISGDVNLQKHLVPFFTGSGIDVYQRFLSLHNSSHLAPYVRELQGIADGSGVAFSALFINQMSEELSYFMPGGITGSHVSEHCSDLMHVDPTAQVAYLAHNEDSGHNDIGHIALVHAPKGVAGGQSFAAMTYLGNLPTGAFGWNSNIAFTLNYVAPAESSYGLGRVFLARDLLESRSLEDGLKRVSVPNMAAGHNYQIMEWGTLGFVDVEVAPRGRSADIDLSAKHVQVATSHFHANTYIILNESQPFSNSSAHRLRRAAAIMQEHAIRGRADMLALIGDQQDRQWPIFHDEYSHEHGGVGNEWTLASIFVDGAARSISLWDKNPKLEPCSIIDVQ